MLRIYDFVLLLVYGLLSMVALVSSKYRPFLKTKSYTDTLPPKQTKRILIHCASLGEFEIVRPIVRLLKKSGYELVISFFSPSGFVHVRIDNQFMDHKVYLPKDTKKEMLAFFLDIQPDYVLITKSEFWPNMLHTLAKLSIPFAFLAIELDYPNSRYFRFPMRQLLKSVRKADHFFTQTDYTKQELIRQNIPNSKITTIGNPRILSIVEDQSSKLIDKGQDRPTIIFGSVYPDDIPMIQNCIAEYPNFRCLIFPHHLDADTITRFKQSFPTFTEYIDVYNRSNMLISKMGLLKISYPFADIAYIGGGFQNGVHNTLEAILQDCPTIIGPKNKGFPEITFFKNTPYLYQIENRKSFNLAFSKLMASPKDQSILTAYISNSVESTVKVTQHIQSMLS